MSHPLSTRIVFHAYLNNLPAQDRDALLHYLAPTEKEVIDKLPKTYGNPLADQETDAALLRHIDASWIAPFLRGLSTKEIGFFLAALDKSHATAVGKALMYTGQLPTLTLLGKLFFQHTLLKYFTAEIEELLPIAALPDSPLNHLLKIEDQRIGQSPDCLGLHDLAIEIRQIIDTSTLTAIYNALDPHQLAYLKIIIPRPESVAFTKMGLTHWNRDQEKLRLLIQQRGANRLAKALYPQDPSLIWYVLHRLDVEKALMIKKLCAPVNNSRALQILIDQVIEFFNYIKRSHE